MIEDVRTYVLTVDATGIPGDAHLAFRRELRLAVEGVLVATVRRYAGADLTVRLDDVGALLGELEDES